MTFIRSLFLLCLIIGVLQPSIAQAVYYTGRDLAAQCEDEDDRKTASCLGYVAGVIDYHVMLQSLGTAPTTDFCLPDDLSVSRATTTILDYLKKNPQHLDFIAGPTIAMALAANHPCAKPTPRKKKR